MNALNAGKHKSRWVRRSAGAAIVLVLAYCLLLIPERKPVIPEGANRQPFVWRQDQFWSELEAQFRRARTEPKQALTNQIDELMASLTCQLADGSVQQLSPEAPVFLALETNLFQLAPLVAACPERLPDYVMVANRARRFVKEQSARWDLNSQPARQRLYRLLFGGRMALEEVVLQCGSNTPALLQPDDAAAPTPSTEVLGVTLHSGDILVSRGGAPTSALISRGNDYPGGFSHVALAYVDEQTHQVSMIESLIECGVVVTTFNRYLEDKKLRLMLLRLRPDLPVLKADPLLPHKAATAALKEAQQRHIPYDFSMNCHDHGARFCSEVVSAAYEPFGVKLWTGMSYISSPVLTAWLGSMGARFFETQEPADLEYDPQLEVIAEWREPVALQKAHIDDAVIDVMLSEAKPGQGLDYSLWLLPVARAAKLYSVLLNQFGKTGPIPEGLSATAALRVDKHRAAHAARAARLGALANDFEHKHGYAPPYWELVRLAASTDQR